ncbi:hypothetical protein ACLKA6_011593 [Drosophila palustris]
MPLVAVTFECTPRFATVAIGPLAWRVQLLQQQLLHLSSCCMLNHSAPQRTTLQHTAPPRTDDDHSSPGNNK